MPKKSTARQHRSRRTVSSRDSELGLIVRAKAAEQPAGTECTLDNRSHRTPTFSCKAHNKCERSELHY